MLYVRSLQFDDVFRTFLHFKSRADAGAACKAPGNSRHYINRVRPSGGDHLALHTGSSCHICGGHTCPTSFHSSSDRRETNGAKPI